MKALLLICSGLLLLGIADLPIGYYTFLRVVVTIGAVSVAVREYKKGASFWFIGFSLLAIVFNPILPVYLYDKSAWIPIDFIGGVLFGIKSSALKERVN
jgi:hypothetical protein